MVPSSVQTVWVYHSSMVWNWVQYSMSSWVVNYPLELHWGTNWVGMWVLYNQCPRNTCTPWDNRCRWTRMPLVDLESYRIRLWASRMPWQYRTRRQSLDRRTLYDRVLTSSNHVMWVSLREDPWWVLVLVEEVIMLWVLVLVGRLYRHSVLGLCHTIHAEIFCFCFVVCCLLFILICYCPCYIYLSFFKSLLCMLFGDRIVDSHIMMCQKLIKKVLLD